MNRRKLLHFLYALALLASLIQTASAVCTNRELLGDRLVWMQHECDNGFRTWFRNTYNLQEQDWDEGWGWDECDPSFAFPKMLNAGYLLAYGLQDEKLGPWHSSSDYSDWAADNTHPVPPGFLFYLIYTPKDENGSVASTWGVPDGLFASRIEMNCPGFDSDVASRAGTMLHEATHAAYGEEHWPNDLSSDCMGPCTDMWFLHTVDEYGYGDLKGHKHSAVQIQIEFLCDLSEFRKPWVDPWLAIWAKDGATNKMDNRILNPPGWTCGDPRPMYQPPPRTPEICPQEKPCCADQTPVDNGCTHCVDRWHCPV